MAEDKDFYAYDELSDTAKERARRSLADYRASHGWYANAPGTDDWKSFAEAFNDIGYDARVDSYGNVDLEFKGRSSDSGADDGPVSSDWYYDDELTNEALEPGFRDYVIDLTYLDWRREMAAGLPDDCADIRRRLDRVLAARAETFRDFDYPPEAAQAIAQIKDCVEFVRDGPLRIVEAECAVG